MSRSYKRTSVCKDGNASKKEDCKAEFNVEDMNF